MSTSFKRQPKDQDISDHRLKAHLKHEMKQKEKLIDEYSDDETASQYLNDPVFYRCLKEK